MNLKISILRFKANYNSSRSKTEKRRFLWLAKLRTTKQNCHKFSTVKFSILLIYFKLKFGHELNIFAKNYL